MERQVGLLTGGPTSAGLPVSIDISLRAETNRLDLNTPENYSLLLVRGDGQLEVSIEAENYYGARHGLETLFQLVVWDEVEESHLMLDKADIRDWPEFPHRGISVDTVRNFIPVQTIKTVTLTTKSHPTSEHFRSLRV